jgi:hypothetical protein
MTRSLNPCSACGGSTGRHCICPPRWWRWCRDCARLSGGDCGAHGPRLIEVATVVIGDAR